ncbi:hypothetical protein FWK35_00037082, partial [Aphis craccivora]
MLRVFFFLYLCTRERVEIMLQFQTLGVVSDRKMNLVSAFGRSFEFPIVFQSAGKNQKKIKDKLEFLRKTGFRPNQFFYMVVIQKPITLFVSIKKFWMTNKF